MRYWQVTTRRLSTAAQKLEMDDAWHPFSSTPHSWYRVWKRKLVQRVTFRDQAEENRLLENITELEPLEDMVQTAGFREEIDIEEIGKGLALLGLLGYPAQADKRMTPLLKKNGMSLLEKEGLVFIAVPTSLSKPGIMLAQEKLLSARLLFQAIVLNGPRAWEAGVAAFENTLRNLEDIGHMGPK